MTLFYFILFFFDFIPESWWAAGVGGEDGWEETSSLASGVPREPVGRSDGMNAPHFSPADL